MEDFWAWTVQGDAEEVLKVGVFGKDKTEGPLYGEWQAFYANLGVMKEEVEVSSSFSTLLARKDGKEVECVELAGKTASLLMQELVAARVLSAIDEGKRVTHAQLTETIEGQISDQLGRYKAKLPSKLSLEQVDICYPPIIQSGGHYSLKPSAISNDERLAASGVVLCSLGIRYRSYCSNVGRTLLVDGSRKQEGELSLLLELQSHLIGKAVPGMSLAGLYEAAVEFIRQRNPELEGHLTANLGFGMGIEFRESELLLSPKSGRAIEPGMVFNLALGLQGLSDPGSPLKDATYALLVADTVLITGNGLAERLTEGLSTLKDLSYSFKSAGAKRAKASVSEPSGPSIRSRLRNHQPDLDAEKRRKEHQRALMIASTREMLARYTEEEDGAGEAAKEKRKPAAARVESYRKESSFPRDACTDWKIVVDKRAETLILPIQGFAVPFHISTVKNVTKNEEGDFVCLRINLNTPGRTFGGKEAAAAAGWENPLAEFVRGLVFRSADAPRVQETFRAIQELRKAVAEREHAAKEMSDLVAQASLAEISGRRPARLADVYARPSLETRRAPGDVEIHANGIRFRSQLKADQRIDVLFANIAHAFLQPCDHESVVIVHLHLRHPIMVGKRKTRDVQFYREAIDSLVDETSGRRTRMRFGDEDELAQEAEERKRRAEANAEFRAFTERLVEAAGKGHVKLDIDVPFRDLGFTGIVSKQSVLLQPTTDCLVQLVEPPFLVVPLGEVEIAYLERVMFGLKNFDLVLVLKDHARPPVAINSVPTASLEAVKDWLDSVDVPYAESKINFNWTNVLKTIKEDPVDFYENGGWASLQPDSAGEESDAEEDQSSAYEPDDEDEDAFEESQSEDESEFSESDSEEEEEESDFDDSNEEEEESDAPDWDELEAEAAKEDARREAASSAAKRKAPPAKKPAPRRR
jgi:nucleosome binding factor SPN SPT16 subunit